jgi:DNA-binding transcriptional regulator YdaS (Cro superfamily)
MLALAHHWRGLIRSGVVTDQAALARLVGVSRARITQVMDLLYLAPDIQEEILVTTKAAIGGVRHRSLLPIAATADWPEQRRLWRAGQEA